MRPTRAQEAALRRAVFWVDGGPAQRFLASAFAEDRSGAIRIRYDAGCMRPAHAAFQPAADFLDDAFGCCPLLQVEWAAGDGIVIDNWRCLHGRAATDIDDSDRTLERVTVL